MRKRTKHIKTYLKKLYGKQFRFRAHHYTDLVLLELADSTFD